MTLIPQEADTGVSLTPEPPSDYRIDQAREEAYFGPPPHAVFWPRDDNPFGY
jgi:hypothetical protein